MSDTITASEWITDKDYGGMYTMPDPPPQVDDKNTPMIGPDDPAATQIAPEPQPAPIAEPLPPPAATEDDEPVVTTLADGSVLTIEKTKKGWKGTVDIGTGTQQVYYGKTKTELIINVLTAQANATKKIREQSRQLKLGVSESAPVVQKVETAVGRKLTPDESLEIRTLFETDPDTALEKWFATKTGKTPAQLVAEAEEGRRASMDLAMESAAKGFIARNPDYYADPNFENYQAILGYLSKTKLRRALTKENGQEIAYLLVSNGYYTVETLEDAYTELKEDGLLLAAPRPPKVTAPPTPAPTEERIVRTETRPRAGYGISPSETTQTRPVETTPPSEIDFNSLSNEELDRLLAETTRLAIKQRK